MKQTLEQFIATVRSMEKEKVIATSQPMSDFDLMIQYAIGSLGELRGYPLDITITDIYNECRTLGDYAIKLLEERA